MIVASGASQESLIEVVSGKPLSNVEIAAAIVAAKGYGEEAMPALIRRVRANLSYLRKHDQVTKTGDRMTARWGLT